MTSLMFIVGSVSAADLYVATTGDDAKNCLTPETACLTIQEAIDKAGDTDTVNVASGTYVENVLINKDGLHLVGDGSGSTIISPVSGKSIEIRAIDVCNIDGVHIEGFTLKGVAGAITLHTVSGGCSDITYTTNLVITDVVINGVSGSDHGIGLNSVDGVTLTNVQVNNVEGENIKALELTGVRNLILTDSLFENNGVAVRVQGGFDDTIGYGPNGPITITNSRFNNNGFAVEMTNSNIVVNAKKNWWGHITGPYHTTTNPNGEGDAVSDYVDYTPWAWNEDMEVDEIKPSITNVYIKPTYPNCESRPVILYATITDEGSELDYATIRWKTPDGEDVEDTTFKTPIGGQQMYGEISYPVTQDDDGTIIKYSIKAVDNVGNKAWTPFDTFTYDCENPDTDADGPYSADEGSNVPLIGSGSDTVTPTGELVYDWDLNNDGTYETSGQNVNFPCVDDLVDYPISLRVTDNAGHFDTDDTTVTCNNVNPVADADGPYSGDEGSNVALSGSVIDVGTLDTHTYAWDLDDDGVYETPGQDVNFACINDSTNQISLEVTDDDGGKGYDPTTVTCNNIAPVVDAGIDQTVNEGDLVTINPSFTDVGVLDTHTATIDWGDGSPLININPAISPLSDSHTYCADGVYSVIVEVADDDFRIGSNDLTITVNNVAPTFDNLPDSSSGVIGDPFTFDVDASDVGCDTLTYSLVGEPFGMTIDSVTGEISWIPTLGQEGDHIVTVRVNDGLVDVDADLSVHVYDYKINLVTGWNLISIPVVPEESVVIEDVLGDADVLAVYAYDPLNPNADNGWLAFSNEKGSLTSMTAGWGYWVLANSSTVIKGNGELISEGPSAPPSRNLVGGWNLIGHYGIEEKGAINALYSLVNKENGNPTWNAIWPTTSPEMMPEKGYWLAIDGSLTIYTPKI